MKAYIYTFILLAGVIFSCKNPVNELKTFTLNVDGEIAPIRVRVKFLTNDSALGSIPQNVSVSITGPDADKVFDRNGQKNFTVGADGVLELMYSPLAKPSGNNPLNLYVNVTANGCIPEKKQIYLFDKKVVTDINITLSSLTKPSADEKIYVSSLNFLGKKATDSVTISGTDFSGQMTVKYIFPKEGVRFIKSNTVRLENSGKTVSWVWRGRTYEYTVYKYVTTFDTLKAEEVDAILRVYKYNTTFNVTRFYDEAGELKYLPHVFRGRIGSNIYFTDKVTKQALSIYYLPGYSYVTEYETANTNNLKCYVNGYEKNSETGEYVYINNIADDGYFNSREENGKRIVTFNNTLFSGETFLFESYASGCGFVNYKINSNIPLNRGYIGYSSVSLKESASSPSLLSYGVSWRFGESNIYLPAFPDYVYDFEHNITHYEQQALYGDMPIKTQTSTVNGMCNYLETGITENVNLDGFYTDQANLVVDAKILCKNGSYVRPYLPIYYKRSDAVYKWYSGDLYLAAGMLNNQVLRKNVSYYIYTYNYYGDEVGDYITFDPSVPSKVILDDPDPAKSYFSGTLIYNSANDQFTLAIEFDNSKLRMKFAGCAID